MNVNESEVTMKIDEHYSFVYVCPTTGEQLLRDEYSYSSGVCPKCGDVSGSTFTHHDKIVGKWERPNLFERILQEKRAVFHRKSND